MSPHAHAQRHIARNDDTTRDHILSAAFEAFGEYGFAQTSVRHIADRARIAPGSIYTHFADKEELFRSTVEAGWQRMRRSVDEFSPVMRTCSRISPTLLTTASSSSVR